MTMHPFCGLDSGRGRAIILQTDRQTDRQHSVALALFAAPFYSPSGRGASVDMFHGRAAPFLCALERRRCDGKGQSL